MVSPEQSGETIRQAPWPTVEGGMDVLRAARDELVGDPESPAIPATITRRVEGKMYTVTSPNKERSIMHFQFKSDHYAFVLDEQGLFMYQVGWVNSRPGDGTDVPGILFADPESTSGRFVADEIDTDIIGGLASYTEAVRNYGSGEPDFSAYAPLFEDLDGYRSAIQRVAVMSAETADIEDLEEPEIIL